TSSMILAVKKSYAVSAAIFSPRCFMAPNVWIVTFCSFIESPVLLHEFNVPLAFRQLPKKHPYRLALALHNHVGPNRRQRQQHEPSLGYARMRDDEFFLQHLFFPEVQNVDVDRPRGVLRH